MKSRVARFLIAVFILIFVNVAAAFLMSDSGDTPDAVGRWGVPMVFAQFSGAVDQEFFSRGALAVDVTLSLASVVWFVFYPQRTTRHVNA